jgi:hypothetical protein
MKFKAEQLKTDGRSMLPSEEDSERGTSRVVVFLQERTEEEIEALMMHIADYAVEQGWSDENHTNALICAGPWADPGDIEETMARITAEFGFIVIPCKEEEEE